MDPVGRNVFFGVREFGMCAMVNGMAAHGGLIPFGSTFFIFSDYCRPALRLAALMGVHSLFVFTHDSIGLGEDGPTHQPIEQLMSLRMIPHFTDFRPADANETAACWQLALERKSPELYGAFAAGSAGARCCDSPAGARRVRTKSVAWQGHHSDRDGVRGSINHEGRGELKTAGINATVVSMPSFRIYDEQSDEYKAKLLPESTPKLAVEAGATLGWYKYVGHNGGVIGLDRFGARPRVRLRSKSLASALRTSWNMRRS